MTTCVTTPDAHADAELAEAAIERARELLTVSQHDESRGEVRRRTRLGTLLADDSGRRLIFALTDEVLRIDEVGLAARRFADVVHRHPTGALGRIDSLLLRVGAFIAPRLPRLVMPLVVRRIRSETHGIVIPADDPKFARHIERRTNDDVRINVNPLGEAILSDAEADERMATVCERIDRSDVDYVSVKVSSIVANLDVLAFDHSIDRIAERLRVLYRRAEAATPRTFVNLDMEEYRDLELTLQSFMRVLDEPEFSGIDAGIVLQAYLPDSHEALDRLGAWAQTRFEKSGGTVKVRLVKGANLAMESVEAELHGWTAAPYATKADVDASYKALLDAALSNGWSGALRIGLASHNLFDIAWALSVGSSMGALSRIEFEMLEGMAPAQARALNKAAGGLLMYAPVVADDDFDASLAYLSRRLDENTQADNFLRSLFTLTPDSAEFERQATMFRVAVDARHAVSRERLRTPHVVPTNPSTFIAEPDSDMTDPAVRDAVVRAVGSPPELVVAPMDLDGVETTMIVAQVAFDETTHSRATRQKWLLDAAALMSAERAETIGLMAHTVTKTPHEGDPEVTEAIDFCRYYATTGSELLDRAAASGLSVTGRGVVVVVGPWNFPYAIPTGGVAASLAAGNSVILKPAPEATEIGARLADQFWRAGVPRDVLQLVVCDDGPVGRHLVTHPNADTVVLTGAYDTAQMFLDWRPDLRVLAETSGKDALVITPSADLDLAIADLVQSAFGHAGQKCSAASLGIVVAEVYDDPTFQRRLRDAVTSLRVGPATDLPTMMGPLIAPPENTLLRALTQLDDNESWLVTPVRLESDPTGATWSPGVRLGVAPESWFHRTECFGPVLGLVRADDLDHAIDIQNCSDFALTGGIHTLDNAEVERWLDRVEIGNAYVNRHITGAIVERQPFGGWKKSSVGGGAKAGGPGYVAQFATIADRDDIDTSTIEESFRSTWLEHYQVHHDATGLLCEENTLRYFGVDRVFVRHDGSRSTALAIVRAAASVTGVELVESATTTESDERFAADAAARGGARVRLLTDLTDDARRLLHAGGLAIDASVPVSDPMIELQRWVREQAISRTMHRHGRLV